MTQFYGAEYCQNNFVSNTLVGGDMLAHYRTRRVVIVLLLVAATCLLAVYLWTGLQPRSGPRPAHSGDPQTSDP